ncbi:MAG: septum formation protein Maf [Actinobacteria bacterium]|nr:MAG: septum formation protein Maf [Actinomycetota bacterium]
MSAGMRAGHLAARPVLPSRPMSDSGPSLLLASASPRRRRLLAWLGLPYECASFDTPEDLATPAADPQELACLLAAEKAVAARGAGLGPAGATVLGFDTIVVLDGDVLGKPADTGDAWRMLRALSGRTHEVVTGCAVLLAGDLEPRTFAVTTRVLMRELDDDAIRAWMARGEYLGCAGAYNIEGQVAEVTGDECYQNVAGLPLCHLRAELAALGIASASPVAACDAALGRSCTLGPRVTGV